MGCGVEQEQSGHDDLSQFSILDRRASLVLVRWAWAPRPVVLYFRSFVGYKVGRLIDFRLPGDGDLDVVITELSDKYPLVGVGTMLEGNKNPSGWVRALLC